MRRRRMPTSAGTTGEMLAISFTGGQRERFGLGGMGPDLFCPQRARCETTDHTHTPQFQKTAQRGQSLRA
jgi:hypothetical protein